MDRTSAVISLACREDWLAVGPRLLALYLPWVERGAEQADGEIPLSGARPFARWFEGLVRPMSLGAPLLAGAGGRLMLTKPDGQRVELGDWYRRQVTIGVDPEHPRRWVQSTRPMDQTIVETSMMTICLNAARPYLWDPLPAHVKTGLAKWMDKISHQLNNNINNWNIFPIVTQLGLRRLGMPHDQAQVDGLLEQMEKFYHADGWYADGYYRQFDYYVPEAIYQLIIAAAWSDDDALKKKIFDRAALFARDYALFFDGHGRNIFFGRSRSYRFSASFFFALCAWCDVPGVDPGLCRSIISRNIAWYLNQRIYADDGRLTGGCAYPNERVNEIYIGPGSCAWAFQSFLPLALPASHPFWTAPEPERPRALQRHMPAPNFVVTVDEDGGNATLHNGGCHHPFDFGTHPSKYGKFAYSSHFGFNLADGIAPSVDNMISLMPVPGDTWSHRYRFEIRPNHGPWMVSRHQPFAWDPETVITTALLVRGAWQVRVHRLELARPCRVREGGTPVTPKPGTMFDLPDTLNSDAGIELIGDNGRAGGWALHGALKPTMEAFVNVNVLHRRVAVPLLESELSHGTHLLVTAWFARAEDRAPEPATRPLGCRLTGDGEVEIAWGDGQTDRVCLPATRGEPLNIITGGGFPWPSAK